ncbi:MAG: M56 family metallopeptidase [Chloroflexi bacterium]|nr:M56 family metallopeptidase [Chloroflexota bacterium]
MESRDKVDSLGEETRAVVIAASFAVALTLAGLVIWLWPSLLSPLTIAYQAACERYPDLFSWSKHVLPLLPVLIVCLVFSSLIAAAWTMWSQLETARRLSRAIKENTIPAPHKLRRVAAPLVIPGCVICVKDRRLYAFCKGIRQPQICVSSGLVRSLNEDELRAVLLHELYHLRHRDPLRLLGIRVVGAALQMLPVVGELQQRYCLVKEIAADRAAIKGTSVVILARALLKVLTADEQMPELASAPIGALSITKERVTRLANADDDQVPPLTRRSIVSSTFVALALFVSTFGFAEASSYWATKSHDCHPLPVTHKATIPSPVVSAAQCSHIGNYENPLPLR